MQYYKKGCHHYRVNGEQVLHVNTDGCINSIEMDDFLGNVEYSQIYQSGEKIEPSNVFEFDKALQSTASLIGVTLLVFNSN